VAYVSSFEHDIFISYAHADNSAGNARVSAFHRDLVQRLTTALGARAFHKPQEWVFFDRSGLKAGDEFHPKIERAVRRSAVMISLLSRSYLQAPFCIKETEWFLNSKELAQNPIQRRLIPIVLNPTQETALQQFPHLGRTLLRRNLCSANSAHEPGSPEWRRVLEEVANELADHLQAAREHHGAVYVGQAYKSAESCRTGLIEELRGFRCIPENAIFAQESALKQALSEAKLAVHFLGDTGAEVANSVDAILWSLEHCPGKTIGYLPPGQELADEERQLLEHIRNKPRWTRPECNPTELAEILTRELEAYRMPDPSTPIALACDLPDLDAVRAIARQIHERSSGAFAVGTPDFLAKPTALPFSEWKKLLTRSPSVLVYWREGKKEYLKANVERYLPAAKLGRAWYVSLLGPEQQHKRDWQPDDLETEKIVDEDQGFRYERLQDFLDRVRQRARK
jgi:hypothetical protein